MNNSYKTLCVVNPVSANGRTRKSWGFLEKYLKEQGVCFDVKFTKKPQDAINITREALYSGYEHIVSVGGDGTLNEVVNGFYNGNCERIKEDSFLSIIPMGTGGDFARMLSLSCKPQKVHNLFKQGQAKEVDIVRSTFTSWNGYKESRYYINVADVGLGSETVYRVNRRSKALGGFLSFLIAAVYSVLTYKNKLLTVKVDDKEVYTGKCSMVAIGNGGYFGGGMKIAPHAVINDGLLDVIIIKDLSKLELISNLPSIYAGKHLNVPNVDFLQGRKVEITSEEDIFVEMDGETPGKGNLKFEVIPSYMKLIL